MIYITSDLHLGHKNICKGTSKWTDLSTTRPFNTTDEMDDALLAGINTLKATDVLLHLGDFTLGGNPENYFKRIIPQVIFMKGNHDYKLFNRYSGYGKYTFLDKDIFKFDFHGQLFVACHYPLIGWEGETHGSIMIHGHCHLRCPDPEFYKTHKIIDVGASEERNWLPWSIDELIERFK